MAGIFVCSQGIADGACAADKPSPNITTQVSFHALRSSFLSSRENYTISSIAETTDVSPVRDLELPAYRDALRWLLNYTDADIPPPTSIASGFWSSQKQLADPSTWGILAQNFQSLLVFPFWLFNDHNWGSLQVRDNATLAALPPGFYTEASLVEPYVKLRIDRAMFALFLALQVAVLLFVTGVAAWVGLGKRPVRKPSSFPLFDIVFRANVQGGEERPTDASDDSSIISGLKDTRIRAV